MLLFIIVLFNRILIHYIYGSLIAMLFPDTYARQYPGEYLLYWVHHFFIFFVVPPYLVYQLGIKSLEPFKEISWAFFSGCVMGIHHMYVLQPLAYLTRVNLNFMMCPAIGDPFNGPYYRLAAVGHQSLCLMFSGKAYTAFIRLVILPFLPKHELNKKD
jgi:hypothetical protein